MEKPAMKKTLMTIALISMALSLSASHPNPSELTISLFDGAAFNLTIDNRTFYQQATSYTIPDLRPGKHFVEVVRLDRYFNGRFFVLGAPRVVFSGYIHVPARKRLIAHIDHRNQFVVTQKMNLRQAPVNQAPVYQPLPHVVVLSPHVFAGLKATLTEIRHESSRFDIVRQALTTNHVTAAQVGELMTLFYLESNRLKLAKLAFAYTVDPQNYYFVHHAFRYISSSRELNRYIVSNY